MADLSSAITAMIVLLAAAAAGFIAARLHWYDDHVHTRMSKILLNITLPCMIIASVAHLDRASGGSLVMQSFIYGLALYFGLLIVSWLCNIVLRTPRADKGEYLFMGTLTNLSFIGIAVASSLFGDQAAFIIAVFLLPLNLVLYSFGVIVCTRVAGVSTKIDLRAMLSGPLVASALAVLLFLSGLQLPDLVTESLSYVGSITAPVAMMMVGYVMATCSLRDALGEWRIYVVTLMRQLVVPFVLYVLLRQVVPDPLVLGVFVIAFAMPVGSIASVIVASYGMEGKLAAKGTVISTLMSFATIPALVALMSLIL